MLIFFLLGLSSEFGRILLGSVWIARICSECVGDGKVLGAAVRFGQITKTYSVS